MTPEEISRLSRSSDGHSSVLGRSSSRLEADDDADDSIDISQMLSSLWRQRRIMLLTFVMVVGIGALYTVLQKPIYQANATIIVSTPHSTISSGNLALFQQTLGNDSGGTPIGTQVEILRSTPLQRRAVRRLSPSARQEAEKYYKVEINPLRDADIIAVSVNSYNPQVAIELSNAICAEYIDQNQQQNREQVQDATRYVSDQLGTVRKRLAQASTDLKDFQQRNGTVDLSEESKTRIGELNQIEADLRAAQTERLATLSQIAASRGQIEKIAPANVIPSNVVRTPRVEAMKGQLTQLELQRVSALSEYTPTSRVVRNLDQQINTIRQSIAQESRTEVGSWQPNPIRLGLEQDIVRLQSQERAQEARIRALQVSAQQAHAEVAQLPERAYRMGQLTTDQDVLNQTYRTLNAQYQTLRISHEARVADNRILAGAELLPNPISPRKAVNIGVTMVLAALLAIGLAIVANQLDNRIHSDEDAEVASGLPVVARIPSIEDESQQLLTGGLCRNTALLESYRMMRAYIRFSSHSQPIRSLVMSSSQSGEGKSTNAINLAAVMALDGKRVILVDTDLRRPSVHLRLGLASEQGFTDVVAGTTSLEAALQPTNISELMVLTSGPLPESPTELLNSRQAQACLKKIIEHADFVVFDTPSALTMADAQSVAVACDALLLVTCAEESGSREVARTSDLLAQTGVRMIGVVLNKVTGSLGGFYYGKTQFPLDSRQANPLTKHRVPLIIEVEPQYI